MHVNLSDKKAYKKEDNKRKKEKYDNLDGSKVEQRKKEDHKLKKIVKKILGKRKESYSW